MRDKVFVPRFYVDHLQFLKHCGILGEIAETNNNIKVYDNEPIPAIDYNTIHKFLDFNPIDDAILNYASNYGTIFLNEDSVGFTIPTGMNHMHEYTGDDWYIGYLNHNFYHSHTYVKPYYTNDPTNNLGQEILTTEVVNKAETSEYNGFSLEKINTFPIDDANCKYMGFNFKSKDDTQLLQDIRLGAISLGKIIDVPFSADLNLTQSYEYGVDVRDSKYGATFTNPRWWQKPAWSGQPAWELNKNNDLDYLSQTNDDIHWRKSGKRVYNLTFSFLDDDTIFPTSGVVDGSTLENNLHVGDTTSSAMQDNGADVFDTANPISIKNDKSIYAQLLHKTMGFSLPFIFQPDKTYAKPDGFMLAKVDSRNGLSINQLAPNLWRIKLKIEEIW
tara:strand:+ start:2731 stop:3894 length:1164 start_codon:yes stop_codon:yes gene_type:complete